ncbi:MAG: phospho-N-acetylmuramoyl-pentapeptide-transferase [Armatimonadia bacterium]
MPSNIAPILIALALPLGLVLSAFFTWIVWRRMVAMQIGQTVRSDGPESHLKKMGTPTLGGAGILAALVVLCGLVVAALSAKGEALPVRMLAVLGLALAYGALGFADDWPKVRYKRPLGLKARVRLPIEFALAAAFAYVMVRTGTMTTTPSPLQIIPFQPDLIWGAFVLFVIVGGANAVNLTDGLDGLAAGVSAIVAVGLAVICTALGHADLAVMSLAVAGVSAGFLWLNAAPAQIFMGDVGSLGLGAALAGIAVAARAELVFGFFGIVFVVEAVSVILQVLYFKASKGKRLFRMAPFHHHLELGGLPETKITARLWLVTAMAVSIGLAAIWIIASK